MGHFSGWFKRRHPPSFQLKHFIRDSSSEAEDKGAECMASSGSHMLLWSVSIVLYCYTELEPCAKYAVYALQLLRDGYGGLAEYERKSAISAFGSTWKLSTSH